MTISRVGSSHASADNCAAISGQQANDLLVVYAFRVASASAPTLPAGWSSVATGSQSGVGNDISVIVGVKRAAGASDTSDTWTNATNIIMVAYRGALSAIPTTPTVTSDESQTYIRYGGLNLADTGGTHWVAACGGRPSGNAIIATAPSGMTNVTSDPATPVFAAHDTNGGYSANWSSTDVTGLASGRYLSVVLELAPTVDYTLSAGAGSFALTGQAVSLRKSWKLAVSAGSFVLTGMDVAMSVFRRAFYRTTVQAEDRTTKARSESRTTSAKSENRTTRVPADPQGGE